MLNDFHLLRPLWLLALLPLALLLVALWRQRTEGSIWRGLIDPHLLPHLLVGEDRDPRRWPLVLLGSGWLLLVLALSGPVWERLPQPLFTSVAQRVILLDLSPSMNAADVAPSRLARARFEIQDLLQASREGQVALLAFGPEPFVVSPLTSDARTIIAQVPQLSTGLLPVPGERRTDLALEQAGELLDQARAAAGDLILVTDAVGHLAASLQEARTLRSAGHRLSVLAVGTERGAPVPAASGGFLKNETGAIDVARLAADELRTLANAGGGRYLESEVGDADTRILTAAAIRPGDAFEETQLVSDRWREEGPLLLLLLLPLAALVFRRGWFLPLLAVSLVLPPGAGHAFDWSDLWARADQQAERHLHAGDAEAAAEQFRDPAWRAAASYRAGDYQQALDALAGMDDPEADYNRGNALARLGRLQDAAAAYEKALEASPEHADARHNLELVRKVMQEQDASNEQPSSQENQENQEQNDRSEGADQSRSGQDGGQDESHANEASDDAGDQEGASGESAQQAGPSGEQASDAPPASSEGDQTGASDPTDATANRQSGTSQPPDASDFGPEALAEELAPTREEGSEPDQSAASPIPAARSESETAREADTPAALEASLTPEERERQQALEAQLRRVPDDPSGLLRQRFLLQHLRREGRLP